MKAPACARPDRDQTKKSAHRIAEYARADYVDALLLARPALHDESPKTVRRLAALLWRLDAKRYRHLAGDGTLSIPYQELGNVFGSRKFPRFNRKHQILIDHDPSFRFTPERTKRYSLHPDILSMDERYLAKYEVLQAELTDILDEDGSTRRTFPKAVAGKDQAGNTAKLWRGTEMNRSVLVNLDRLRWLCDCYTRALQTSLSPDERRILERRRKITRKLIGDGHTSAGRGEVSVRYREADSGRLYGLGFSMQNIHRLVRFAALHGMFDYDVANCHYSIFKQMSERHGFSCSKINDYLANKDDRRASLAAAVGCDVEQIKECLLAAMYGASSFDYDEGAIPGILGKDSVRISKFMAHDWLTALRREVRTGGKVILAKWPHRNRGLFVNEAGKGISRDEPQHKILAHLMQGAEAIILRAMFEAVPDSTNIVLLQHDGFTSRRPLDVAALEAAVLHETGYRIRLEHRELSGERTKTPFAPVT